MSAVVVPMVPAIVLKRVLFTTDFTDASQRALPILAAIARRYGSKVRRSHVFVICVMGRQSSQGDLV